MFQDSGGNRRGIISIEEYLRKRNVIKEKENERKSSGADWSKSQGTAMELAELTYI